MTATIIAALVNATRSKEQRSDDRRAEDDPDRRQRKIAGRRSAGELDGDEVEMIFYQREIGSRLIGLSQLKDVPVWHIHVMPAKGCSTIIGDRSTNI
jgi:hypothetical protein